jgi:hypothetical protein
LEGFKELKPLSNFNIIECCKELDIGNFIGVFMRDELSKIKFSNNECLILNSDVSSGSGIHWMCLFSKDGVTFYFDSYGLSPPLEVLEYCKNKIRFYSTYSIQQDDKVEILCGHYSVYILYKLYNGFDFKDILLELCKCGSLNNIFFK